MINQVIKYVCEEYGVKEYQLKGESRFEEYVIPRQAAWYLLMKCFGLKSKPIALAFNREHSTVRHGCRTFEHKLNKGLVALPENVIEFINIQQSIQAKQIENAININIGIQKLAYKYAHKLSKKADKLFRKNSAETIIALANCLDKLEKELDE